MPRSSKHGKALREAGGLLLAAGLLALMAAWVFGPPQNTGESTNEITIDAALHREPPPLWIDARTAPEYEGGHVPGARLLNPENWSESVPGVLQAWEPGRCAVVYCGTPGGQASREVAERLRAFQLGPVFVLQGGWKAWNRH
jgi:rhodanese-related sulfurtransferase